MNSNEYNFIGFADYKYLIDIKRKVDYKYEK